MSQGRAPDPEYVLRAHTAAVNAVSMCALASGAATLASGDASGAVRLWDLPTRRCRWHAGAPHADGVTSVRLLGGGGSGGEPLLLTQGRESSVKLWDCGAALGAEAALTLPGTTYTFCRVAVARAARDAGLAGLVVAGFDGEAHTAVLRDARAGGAVRALELGGEHGMCMSLAFCPRAALTGAAEGLLIAGMETGMVRTYDLAAGRWHSAAKLHVEPALSVAVPAAADGSLRLLSAGADSTVALTALVSDGGVGQAPLASAPLPTAGVNVVAAREDGRIAITAGWDGRVRLFDLKKKLRPLAVLAFHDQAANDVCFAGRGTVGDDAWLAASASSDARIAIWKLYPKK